MTRSWLFYLWVKYFDMEFIGNDEANDPNGRKFIFFEFPHGVFPMGQFLSGSVCSILPTAF